MSMNWLFSGKAKTAWDMGYLTHLCFHLHMIKSTKAEQTLKAKGETVLDHVVF